MSRAVALSLLLLLIVTGCAPAARGPWTPSTPPGGRALSIFGDRLAFGLRSDPADLEWMVQSGVPWAARYTYLAGGVNTGAGWATWSPAPGAYAAEYAAKSAAAGYIPVFSYYQLQQSMPHTGATEAERDNTNLADPRTMRAYYEDFALLMRSLAGSPRPPIVQVEPDLWGYLEQRSANPASIPASVASSGYADVASEPNNAVGFSRALLDLRDRYAPNVLLAIHASAWGAGRDPAVSTADFDPVPLANASAKFLRSLDSAGRWDLVFHDMIDRDAALSQPADGRRAWWDPTDESVPDFGRWLAYVHALSRALDRRIVLWQVPVGNQRYRTMDNSAGHYQDTRAEYFLAHPDLLADAGVAAVLFGPGVDDATWYTDARKDGITNPDPVSAFGCDRCNTEVSRFADDDGGFLRVAVGAYYRSGGVTLPRP